MLEKIKEKSYFDVVYSLMVTLIALLGWSTNSMVCLCVIMLIAIFSLFLFNDFKYMIPCTLAMIFTNNQGFDSTVFPVGLAVIGSVFVVSLIVFMVFNRKNLAKPKYILGIGLLTISCIIPIFWNFSIMKGMENLVVMYFSYFLFFVILLLFSINLKKGCFDFLCLSMVFIGLLVSSELMLKTLYYHRLFPNQNILSFWYYMGWGLCNEAGIVLCMCLPFAFIQFFKNKKVFCLILLLISLVWMSIGILFTGSRASFGLGYCEIVFMVFWTIIFSKNRKSLLISFGVLFLLGVFGIQIFLGWKKFLFDIYTYLFQYKLNDNNRVELWEKAFLLWKRNPLTICFGNGVVSAFELRYSYNGFDTVFLVYHSTFFEILCSFGLFGFCFFIIHIFQKYLLLVRCGMKIGGILVISFLFLELYGLIDNTYGMYYFMIPLMIIMASLGVDNGSQEIA